MKARIAEADPASPAVRALVGRHLSFTAAASPPEFAFALDHRGLREPGVTLFGLWLDEELVAVGGIKHLDDAHAELKSMHTAEEVRGRGLGRRMLDHLLETARARGYRRVSLETGSTDEFAPARALYASSGFVPCAPFGDYRASDWNTFMSLELDSAHALRISLGGGGAPGSDVAQAS